MKLRVKCYRNGMRLRMILMLFNVGFLVGCAGTFKYYDANLPHHGKTGFLNNYDNSPKPSVLKWYWQRWTTSFPEDDPAGAPTIPVDLQALQNPEGLMLTWLGHSAMLVQMDGMNVLTDPALSDRVSPVSFAGPKRYGKLPLQIEQLPALDVVIISHGHYDHLDLPSLKKIYDQNGGRTQFLVPLGNKVLLESEGIKNVREFDWWQGTQVGALNFTFTPAQHWTARSLFDRNLTLWGGWMVKGSHQVFFAGDTGYSKDFQDIYQRLGAVDVALIPIGAYSPRWFMQLQHIDAGEAVQIHKDLHAKLSLPVHWGTFKLSDEPMNEPPEKLREALQKANLPLSVFPVMKRGETRIVK
ncbi:MBL fold metallo-hydrolase [Bdellovibrio sp. SKB1291214]|uniref:MBL fold metallo-hydrolase n=1 Tax=Bdellovibrio sp. SKB1291214 TaxID=1732569 RepID=UPI0020CE6809|nr:MBL fold metallo-hydrolase [Bdellovibrio sp. SKB1291214]UYL07315.1 MBL fold metallo-hydrolase [Bdellovibrio sp. SKB1291214]